MGTSPTNTYVRAQTHTGAHIPTYTNTWCSDIHTSHTWGTGAHKHTPEAQTPIISRDTEGPPPTPTHSEVRTHTHAGTAVCALRWWSVAERLLGF